jgi:hypothetical protein
MLPFQARRLFPTVVSASGDHNHVSRVQLRAVLLPVREGYAQLSALHL